ncbi:MAG: NAD-dependent epimerase/dehydratase family protein [Methylobacter sp.]
MKYLVTGGSGFIGTNLIVQLLRLDHEILNVDIVPPKIEAHNSFWKDVDIMNLDGLLAAFSEFRPSCVIHLAARTDTDGTHLDEYVVNTKGTENVLAAINATDSIQRVIITSTQFVNQYNGIPKDDFDFAPHTVYGESKVINEQMTRQANLQCVWTIIRPTNIWGPWHLRYPYEFWRILSRGIYIHPGKGNIVRSYGYVKNVVYQIIKIFEAKQELVASQVYYVGDEPIELLDWANGFSVGQVGKKVTVVPAFIVRILAMCGDLFGLLHIKFPITSSRYKSMTTSNGVSMVKTIKAFGFPPYTLEDGIKDTIEWMKIYHPKLIRNKESTR